jgi:hypothetical protein
VVLKIDEAILDNSQVVKQGRRRVYLPIPKEASLFSKNQVLSKANGPSMAQFGLGFTSEG